VALAGSALEADLVLVAVLAFAGRLSRGGEFLFFASSKKRNQKKDDPATRVPPLRFGQPAVLDPRAGPQNSLRGSAAPFKQLRPVRSRSRCVLRRLGTGSKVMIATISRTFKLIFNFEIFLKIID